MLQTQLLYGNKVCVNIVFLLNANQDGELIHLVITNNNFTNRWFTLSDQTGSQWRLHKPIGQRQRSCHFKVQLSLTERFPLTSYELNKAGNWCAWENLPMCHYNEVIMSAITSQITSLTIVYSTVYSGADQRKHQSSASLALVQGIHRGPVNSPHKGPVTRKMFPFDDVIMVSAELIGGTDPPSCFEVTRVSAAMVLT